MFSGNPFRERTLILSIFSCHPAIFSSTPSISHSINHRIELLKLTHENVYSINLVLQSYPKCFFSLFWGLSEKSSLIYPAAGEKTQQEEGGCLSVWAKLFFLAFIIIFGQRQIQNSFKSFPPWWNFHKRVPFIDVEWLINGKGANLINFSTSSAVNWSNGNPKPSCKVHWVERVSRKGKPMKIVFLHFAQRYVDGGKNYTLLPSGKWWPSNEYAV